MKPLVPIAVLLAVIASSPLRAQPAAPSDGPYSCLFEGVNAEQRALAGAAASQQLTDVPPDGQQRGGAALAAIIASTPRCAEAGRWTPDQRELARHYALAQLAREEMRRRYAAQNVDLSFIDGGVTAVAGAPPTFEQLVARVRAQGVTGDRPDSAEDIAFLYLELAAQAEALKAGFSDSNLNRR
jgi:hypothetical protein